MKGSVKLHLPKLLVLPLGLSAAGLIAPGGAEAQPVIEEIIVTARKREERLQEVPVAVTAINDAAIREKSVENPYDLTFHVPGLVVRQGSATRTSPDFFIRGQGATFGSASGVVVYFSEVPLKSVGLAGANIQFFDLESLQVLKGPQGTLFGRSSTGGAVLYSPKRPGNELGGFLDLKLGNLDTRELTGAIDIPVIDDVLSIRPAFNVQRRDGFTQSQSTGEWLDDRHRESYRLGINFTPAEWFGNYTLLQTSNIDESATGAVLLDTNLALPLLDTTPGTGAGWGTAAFLCNLTAPGAGFAPCLAERTGRINTLKADLLAEQARVQGGGSIRKNLTAVDNYVRGRNEQIINITNLDVGQWGFLGDVSFKNILSVTRNRKSAVIREFGATQFFHGVVINNHDLVGFPQRPEVISSDERTDFGDDVVEEFQIHGDIGGKHNWLLGYYFEEVESNFGPPPVFPTFNNAFTVPLDNLTFLFANTSQSTNTQKGMFGQLTTDLSAVLLEGLSLTLGYRRTESESEQDTYALVPGPNGRSVGAFTRTLKFDESAPSWTVSLDYKVRDDVLLYIAHRRGFKPGGINGTSAAANIPGTRDSFDPETLDDVEIGIKADWSLGGIVGRTNAAAFYGEYDQIQRSETIGVPGGGVITQINNIAKGEISGLEIDNQFLLSEQVQLYLNYAWTDAKYTEWPGFTTDIFGQQVPNKDSPFPGVAEHQGTLGARYIFPMDQAHGQLAFYAEYYRQSGVWLDDTGLELLPRRPGYQPSYDNLNLRLDWANALGYPVDASLFVRNALDDEWLVGANSLMKAIGFFTGTYNEPRTFGLQLRWRFGGDAQ